MKLYSIYNALTETFNPPFVARDDTDSVEMVRKAIIGGRDISLLVELDNLKLYFVGEFYADNAEFDSSVSGAFALPLNEIKLPEHVQALITKLKEVKIDK